MGLVIIFPSDVYMVSPTTVALGPKMDVPAVVVVGGGVVAAVVVVVDGTVVAANPPMGEVVPTSDDGVYLQIGSPSSSSPV
jgi:hypothetical protein